VVLPLILLYLVTDQKLKVVYLAPMAVFFVDYILVNFLQRGSSYQADRKVFLALAMYLFMACISLLVSLSDVKISVAVRDVLIFSSPFVVFLRGERSSDTLVRAAFLTLVAGFVLYKGNVANLWYAVLDFDPMVLLFPERTMLEFDLGSVFGLFALFFLHRRQKWWFLFSLAVVLLVGKRVILFSMFPAAVYYFVVMRPLKTWSARAWGLGTFFGVSAVVSVFLPEIAKALAALFGLDVPVEVLLMGRHGTVFALREAIFLAGDTLSMLFGHGPGSADVYLGVNHLVNWGKGGIANPHNDYLKLMYDYGLFGLVGYFFCGLWTFARSKYGCLAWLYTMMVYMVDNSLIFIVYLLPLALISFFPEETHEDTRENVQGKSHEKVRHT